MPYQDPDIDVYLAEQDFKQLVKAGSRLAGLAPLEGLADDALPFVVSAEDWDAEEKLLNDQTFVAYAKKHPDLVNVLDTDDSKWLFTGVFMGVLVTVAGNYLSEFLIDRHRKEKELHITT